MRSEIIKPALTLLLICLVSTLVLSITNSITSEKIIETEKKQAETARQKVLPKADHFELIGDDEGNEVYAGKDASGELVGYTVAVNDKSYGGDIRVMTGMDVDMKVTGISILTINDTPGLGMNAKKDSFLDQYTDKTAGSAVCSKNASGDEIQAITGATRTTEAVTRCVNAAGNAVKNLTEGGN
ncbi:MAG: FMN-binding protein [Lachnospiraceae bacterium]|nr:FMN-binding protein [Lachnospiraceae bacterium]